MKMKITPLDSTANPHIRHLAFEGKHTGKTARSNERLGWLAKTGLVATALGSLLVAKEVVDIDSKAKADVANMNAVDEAVKQAENKPEMPTHKVVAGDTEWSIAGKWTGNGSDPAAQLELAKDIEARYGDENGNIHQDQVIDSSKLASGSE